MPKQNDLGHLDQNKKKFRGPKIWIFAKFLKFSEKFPKT